MKLRVLALLFLFYSGLAEAQCEKPWVFFDLGNTLVDTKSHDYNPMSFIPGAVAYLETLAAAGHPIGLIVDIPEEWGRNYPPEAPVKDLKTAKWLRTLDFVAGKVPEDKTSWTGKAFDPEVFGKIRGRGKNRVFEGRVFLPMIDTERKDGGSLSLFTQAKKMAEEAGCGALYVSEAGDQVKWAKSAGISSFQVGHGFAGGFYLPPEKISDYVAADLKASCTGVFFPEPPSPSIGQSRKRPRPRGF